MKPAEQEAGVIHDVAVIGAGVVGSAIARELSGYQLDVALVDSRSDVGDGTSKANTAILHTGFDGKPGTLEARLVAEGYHRLSEYAKTTGIPVDQTGAVLVAWTDEQLEALPGLKAKAERNGYTETAIINSAEVYELMPSLGIGALGGLTVPGESIICSWTTTLAFATEAVRRGTHLYLKRAVESVDVSPELSVLHTPNGEICARWVINATGLGGDILDREFGYDRFHLTPRRGELLVYDKLAGSLVDRIVLPVPTAKGKGVLISPTIYGNVMLGPTAEELSDRGDTATSESGFDFLLTKGRALMPQLLEEEVTASYAGLRAASDYPDYLIEADAEQRYVVVGGIRSTGLTSSMAIGAYVSDVIAKAGLTLIAREDLPDAPQMPNIGESFLRPYQDSKRIAEDPEYGTVVCFCERVTAGEIRDAFNSTIPPQDLGGLRRRTRAQNGRCQGFFCGAAVADLVSEQGCKSTCATAETLEEVRP